MKRTASKPVPCVVADGEPVAIYDEATGTDVLEVLDMRGVRFRGGRRQIVLVDSLSLTTIKSVVGSVRELEVRNGQLVGRMYFANDPRSQDALRRVQDRHLSELQVMHRAESHERVPAGETVLVNGLKVEGPAVIVRQWSPIGAALVTVGDGGRVQV